MPLRYRLLYDPLFLELSGRLNRGFFGQAVGGSCSAAVYSVSDFFQLCSFIVLFFGVPRKAEVSIDPSARLSRVFFFFDGFAFSLEAAFVPSSVPLSAGIAFSGSVFCSRSLVEFRFGAERLAAYAPSETERYRLALPEGDGSRYRKLDEASTSARLLSPERDAEAETYISRLLGDRFDGFSGSAR